MGENSPWEDDPHVAQQNNSRGALEYLSVITDMLSIPICLTAIILDVLLIFVIWKYKRLKIRANYYLMNVAIFHAVYIASTPCLHIVMDLFFGGNVDVRWYCTWLRLEVTAIFLLLTFCAGFALDAHFERRRIKFFNEYEKYYFYVFVVFYVIAAILYAASITLCFVTGFKNNFVFFFLFGYYCLILVAVSYGYFKRRDLFKTNNYAIKISLFVYLCYLPLFVCYLLLNIFKNMHNIEIVLWYSAFLPEYVAYICSIVLVWKLYQYDKHYKVAFRKLFKRPVPNADYDELNQPDDVEVK